MSKYYYQIKGKLPTPTQSIYGETVWGWPPLVTDVIECDTKQHARELIELDMKKTLPIKIAKKDRDQHDYLLWIKEIKENDWHYKHLFNENKCVVCHQKFTLLQKYQMNCHIGGSTCCSEGCNAIYKEQQEIERSEWYAKQHQLESMRVIYKITNRITNMCYIGKTTQAFTFRWYQHYYQSPGDTKFYKALNNSPVSDWIFEVIEVVTDKAIDLKDREHYWILHYDSVKNGYNSVNATKLTTDQKNGQEQLF